MKQARWDVREADFMAAIIELAQLTGWLVYHSQAAAAAAGRAEDDARAGAS